ncbi:hypothetical protein BV25DRAFT_1916584 [Artomyces pyxidatus]|uniref:Uncharacterized protein n=1 Tax=Artomyces pyxidatus TaxID=48021 RepID=A0ACB8SZ89_9AGAM|nr:hypothetical protein BV25DRAFT_1916584 [Artomyces pyxidatus]
MPAPYDIYRDQLSSYQYGQALWEPCPSQGFPVTVGDVGYIFFGGFRRLFNIHLSSDDASQTRGVPEYFEQLPLLEVFERRMIAGMYQSRSVRSVKAGGNVSGATSLIGAQLSFSTSRELGAMLAVPQEGRRFDVCSRAAYETYIHTHCDRWLAFADMHQLGIRLDDIILVTGCDLTPSWAMAAFMSRESDSSVSVHFDSGVTGSIAANLSISWSNNCNAVYNYGPEERFRSTSNESRRLPPSTEYSDVSRGALVPASDQCVFVRGFSMKRRRFLPGKRLKAHAEPRDYSRHDDEADEDGLGEGDSSSSDEDVIMELGMRDKARLGICTVSVFLTFIVAIQYIPLYSPLHDYILEASYHDPTIDLAIVHDDDLVPYLCNLGTRIPDAAAIASQLAKYLPVRTTRTVSSSLRSGRLIAIDHTIKPDLDPPERPKNNGEHSQKDYPGSC